MQNATYFPLLVIFIFGLGFRDMAIFPILPVFSNGYSFRLISHRKIKHERKNHQEGKNVAFCMKYHPLFIGHKVLLHPVYVIWNIH